MQKSIPTLFYRIVAYFYFSGKIFYQIFLHKTNSSYIYDHGQQPYNNKTQGKLWQK